MSATQNSKSSISLGRVTYSRVVKVVAREFIEEIGMLVYSTAEFSLRSGKSLEVHCRDVASAYSREHLLALMLSGVKEKKFSKATMRRLSRKHFTTLDSEMAKTEALANVVSDLLVYDVAKLLRKGFRTMGSSCR